MDKRISTLIVFLIFLVIPLSFGFNASTSSYSIDSYHTGSSGGKLDTGNYSSRSTLTYQQGGNANATTSSYSFNAGWFEEEIIAEEEAVVTPTTTGGGGGGGGVECTVSANCNENEYCFENVCYGAQCFDDSVCNVVDGEVCWDLRCVKLFDVKILEFESPIVLGDFFDFTYFVKGVANINGDVTINFRIEQNGSVVSSGFDVVYFGSFEEKTETTSLFLPRNVKSGTYEFIIEVNLGTYTAQSSRTVEISVEGGIATLRLFDISFTLDDSIIGSSDELVGIATFENFGTVPTPVDLTFIILNENGNEVHRLMETITVETEEVLRKSFRGLDLPTGKYTIVLETLYNVNVADEFRQNFEIRSLFQRSLGYGLIGLGILAVILFIVLITWLVLRRKPAVRARIAQGVAIRVKQVKVNLESRRRKIELKKLQRIKEREKRLKEKLRNKAERERIKDKNKAERERIRDLGRREKEKIAEERLNQKLRNKTEKMKMRDLRIKEKGLMANERLKQKSRTKDEKKRSMLGVVLGKLIGQRKALKTKEVMSERKISEKFERSKVNTEEKTKKIKSLEKKKALLKKGFQTGYINKDAYNTDMKKINKLISQLKKL